MSGAAFVVSIIALALAAAAFVQSIRLRRFLRQTRDERRQADELLYAAWLEEIEARGEHILARIEGTAGATPAPSSEEMSTPEKGVAEPMIRSKSEQEDVKNCIRALARAGGSPAEIARRLHLSAGEVEVILDLERRDDL